MHQFIAFVGIGAWVMFAASYAAIVKATSTCTKAQQKAARFGLDAVFFSFCLVAGILWAWSDYQSHSIYKSTYAMLALGVLSPLYGYLFLRSVRAAKAEAATPPTPEAPKPPDVPGARDGFPTYGPQDIIDRPNS